MSHLERLQPGKVKSINYMIIQCITASQNIIHIYQQLGKGGKKKQCIMIHTSGSDDNKPIILRRI